MVLLQGTSKAARVLFRMSQAALPMAEGFVVLDQLSSDLLRIILSCYWRDFGGGGG
jgi:hypothetical protein